MIKAGTSRKPDRPDQKVAFAVFDTAWGSAGLAWTANGLCQLVLPGMTPAQVETEIKSAYPAAEPGEPRAFSECLEMTRRYFNGQKVELSAPIDFFWTTPFRERALRALMKIPYGATRSYAQVAAALGSPGAARAIGQANAVNRVPLFVPCHRVIAADGSPGGFSGPGGVEYKLRLLEMESRVLKKL